MFLSYYLQVIKLLLSSLLKIKTRSNALKLLLTGYKATPKLALKTKTRSNVPKLRLKGYKACEYPITAQLIKRLTSLLNSSFTYLYFTTTSKETVALRKPRAGVLGVLLAPSSSSSSSSSLLVLLSRVRQRVVLRYFTFYNIISSLKLY